MSACFWHSRPHLAMASSFTRFLNHTQRHTTLGRTPLDEWSARRRDLYLTTHNTQHSQQTNIHSPGGIRTQDSAGERSRTYALDRANTGTGKRSIHNDSKSVRKKCRSKEIIIFFQTVMNMCTCFLRLPMPCNSEQSYRNYCEKLLNRFQNFPQSSVSRLQRCL